jgi:hypothetical protein
MVENTCFFISENFGKWKPKFLKIRFSFTEVLRGKIRFWGVKKIHGGWEEKSSGKWTPLVYWASKPSPEELPYVPFAKKKLCIGNSANTLCEIYLNINSIFKVWIFCKLIVWNLVTMNVEISSRKINIRVHQFYLDQITQLVLNVVDFQEFINYLLTNFLY